MLHAQINPPPPVNEPVLSYAPGTPERAALKRRLAEMGADAHELPLVIAGRDVRSGQLRPVRCPHRHRQIIARYHTARDEDVLAAIDAARDAHSSWASMPWSARVAVFLRAAELISGKYRATINAATMLGQGKTAHQAEIDAACETADFLRFNAHYYARMMAEQPLSPPGSWNQVEVRPLEGFVYAVTPFNFTAIAANLPTAPALLGNTVLWKPAGTAALSAHFLMEILLEAGLPAGVINLVYGDGPEVSAPVLAHPDFAGLHFTGSTAVFNALYGEIARGVGRYKSYPRVVGETGGKDFIVAHRSADPDALAVAIVRGGFEFQGQKCSAASRVYVPDDLWPAVRARVIAMTSELRVGPIEDFRNFMGAVIDAKAFAKHKGYLELAHADPSTYRVLTGGTADDSEGYFVQPTVVETFDPRARLMTEEIFGPIVTAYVYPAASWEAVLSLVDTTSPYALTGAVFSRDRAAIEQASRTLRYSAGNFYVNDKPTGAVVGQQPFGGGRSSGTNDKAGSALNLWRWASPRAVKENLAPPTHWSYPFMSEP